MASFDSINYSLRPNKQIERAIAFDGVRKLAAHLPLSDLVYIGFGSVWFTDFQLAHKMLGVQDMRSMEENDIGFKRASFNLPYKTVTVSNKTSALALPDFKNDAAINMRPWMIWLDYDDALDDAIVKDVEWAIENSPINSIFLVTVSATPGSYGKPRQRPQLFKTLLGDVADDTTEDECRDTLPGLIARLLSDFMKSKALAMSRPGGFVPAFKMIYKDTAPMVTIGGVLPSRGARTAVEQVISKDWNALISGVIEAPHLTHRETVVLQSQLPTKKKLTRKLVQKLGFDLKEEQIESFVKYYRYYPSFAQISI
ncbi:O-methyltransferase [Rhizobium leguminosarum]|uniref:O-methyltransferase n=1 Tax=Rhizobium leguminosarum TaxID=384 RepID=UPI0021BC2037|nr:O-methyltransferase [Rhizobium leguminosarum]